LSALKDIAQVISGYTFRERLDVYPDGDVAVIQMKNLDAQNRLCTDDLPRVDIADLGERQLLRQGDVIFRSRGTFHTAALFSEDVGRAVVAAPLMVIRLSGTKVLPEYLRWFINLPATQAKLSMLATGTHVQTVNKGAIEDIEIPIVQPVQQRRIAELAELSKYEQAISTRIAERKARVLEEMLARHAWNAR